MVNTYDVIIIGGGIGGLVAAALLADKGARVLLLEQATTTGGCAATFSHRGYRFDAGATIGCGFHSRGPMQWVADRLAIKWPLYPLSVAWKYNDGVSEIDLDPKQEMLRKRFPESTAFWLEQAAVANTLWDLTNGLLSQYGRKRFSQARFLASSLSSIPGSRCIMLATMTVSQWLKRHGLHGNKAFCRFIDAQLLISAQTTARKCNALFAALALDLPRQSPCSISGGTGTVAEILSQAIGLRGGEIHLQEKVIALTTRNRRIKEVISTRANYQGREVIVNGSSASLAALLGRTLPSSWKDRSRALWGAFILHLGISQESLLGHTFQHLQLVRPKTDNLAEGDSLFLSLSHPTDQIRAPQGKRALTVSTHTKVPPWWHAKERGKKEYSALKSLYTEKAMGLLYHYLPGLEDNIELSLAGTPVTYQRYTGRHLGLVGGYAQTGLLAPRQKRYRLKNCSLVGDHRFPGQSIAGVTIGAAMAVDHLLRRL
ncbi:MAG: NAD(P)/FAD-dependent oxidoreductase [Proteobacteria bacterium]|nr:NAD(P)/FAD-dependent oxidoreductase [Pseudomonadota bacterium]